MRMGNEVTPWTGDRYTGGGAARPARILPRPAPRGLNREAGLTARPRGSRDPAPSSFPPREFRPLLSLTCRSSPAFLPASGVPTLLSL